MKRIGVFDSGVGGLSVWRELTSQIPDIDTLYLADQAHIPYGPQPPEAILEYSRNIVKFLEQEGCTAVVLACNTASAVALQDLRAENPRATIRWDGACNQAGRRNEPLGNGGGLGNGHHPRGSVVLQHGEQACDGHAGYPTTLSWPGGTDRAWRNYQPGDAYPATDIPGTATPGWGGYLRPCVHPLRLCAPSHSTAHWLLDTGCGPCPCHRPAFARSPARRGIASSWRINRASCFLYDPRQRIVRSRRVTIAGKAGSIETLALERQRRSRKWPKPVRGRKAAPYMQDLSLSFHRSNPLRHVRSQVFSLT